MLGVLAGSAGLIGAVAAAAALVSDVVWPAAVAGLAAVVAAVVALVVVHPPAPVVVTQPGDDDGVTDPVTGVHNARFFDLSVSSRILSARRQLRPVAVVVLEVVEGAESEAGPEGAPADPVPVARTIQRVLRECDTVCRLDGCRFGLVLEDTNPDGAIWAVERLRRVLIAERPHQTHRAGVACYPAHAFEAGELLGKATEALESARDWPQDRIEVALAD